MFHHPYTEGDFPPSLRSSLSLSAVDRTAVVQCKPLLGAALLLLQQVVKMRSGKPLLGARWYMEDMFGGGWECKATHWGRLWVEPSLVIFAFHW